ncbi:MAG: hypothetical protein ACUVX8_01535 [Candidatus Zipacnadales bacterium]
MSRRLRILIIAPEASSDVAAALLAERILARHDVQLAAAGRSALRKAGVRIAEDTSTLGQVGLASVVLSVPRWWWIGRRIVEFARQEPPDALVLFACRQFHLMFLNALRELHPRVAWAYPPGDWVQTDERDEQVLRAADLFISAFAWQAERLERQGARVVRVPHHSTLPLPDTSIPPQALAALRPNSGHRVLIALFPGSRPDEVGRLMPIFARVLRLLAKNRPQLHALISQAPNISASRLRRALVGLPCTYVLSELPVRAIARQANVAITCCGTASTEVAMADCPQVIVYKPSWLTAKFMQRLGRRKDIHFLSMLNLGMKQRVAPELLHTDCRPDRIAAEVGALLDNPTAIWRMRRLYAEFRAMMNKGSWDEAADAVVSLAASRTHLDR